MGIDGKWKNEYFEVLESKGITGLQLSDRENPGVTDIEFIRDLQSLRELGIYSWELKDISPIESLPKLQSIALECRSRKPIDFTKFPDLQHCYMHWIPKSDSIFSATSLKSLDLSGYPHEDLKPLKDLCRLEIFASSSRKLKNFLGTPHLEKLRDLFLIDCFKLESLEGIQGFKNLAKLRFSSCKQFGNVAPLRKLLKLNNVILENCGKLESLHPFRFLSEPEELHFVENTIIEDGDISVIESLPALKRMIYTNRRHYSHKREEVKAVLKKRELSNL